MDFFNKLTGDGDKKPGKGRANATSGGRVGSGGGGSNNNNNKGPQFKNPFANVNLGGLQLPGGAGGSSSSSKNFRGGGQSLGGSKPGRIIRIELPIAGPLGVKVEKRQGAKTAIVSQVLPDTQAAAAQLQRGDVICVADTQGEVEMLYDDFLKVAASDVRPLVFDIRRIDGVGSVAAAGGSAGGSSTADAYAKRQAVIAAAEARDKAHKKKTKPIAKGTGTDLTSADRKKIEEQREEQARKNAEEGIGTTATSAESKRAVEAAKAGEAQHAATLGYNPYETNKVSAGQARTATVAVTHGALGGTGGSGGRSNATSSSAAAPGTVSAPSNPVSATSADDLTNIDPQFDEAFEAVAFHTSNNETAKQALTTMKKLIVNATTKGQTGDEETSAKFRRVRLSNPKIKAAITDVHGALDLMMSVGFVLRENDDDGETYLVFPPGSTGPSWLPRALKKMEKYAQA